MNDTVGKARLEVPPVGRLDRHRGLDHDANPLLTSIDEKLKRWRAMSRSMKVRI